VYKNQSLLFLCCGRERREKENQKGKDKYLGGSFWRVQIFSRLSERGRGWVGVCFLPPRCTLHYGGGAKNKRSLFCSAAAAKINALEPPCLLPLHSLYSFFFQSLDIYIYENRICLVSLRIIYFTADCYCC